RRGRSPQHHVVRLRHPRPAHHCGQSGCGTHRDPHHPAGNLTAQNTPKPAQAHAANQDDLPLTPPARGPYPLLPGNHVHHPYGAAGAADNAADRITEVHDAAGTVTRGYGPLGELTRETRTVTAINGPARTYTTGYRFDSWNRMLQLTYPDGELLTYDYDTGG